MPSNYTYVGSGGITMGGPLDNIIDYGYCADATVPIRIGGSADTSGNGIVTTANFIYEGSGGISIGGEIEQTLANFQYTMSGGVTIGGGSTLENEIRVDIGIGWDTLALVTIDIPLGWNTGTTPLFWYRVEGVCEPLQCPPVAMETGCNPDSSNYSYIQNIVASNVCDVCTQLANKRFIRTIKSIQVFSNPARESDIESFEAQGKIDPFCNNLTQVDFCQCPPCAQFCDYEGVSQGTNTVTTTQQITVQNGYKVTYELMVIRNRLGRIIEQYYYPIYTPDYVTLIQTTTTTKPGYTVLTTGRVRIGGEAIVSWKPHEIPLAPDTSVVPTNCGCGVPTEVYFTHDLAKAAVFNNFLQRNGLKIPKTVLLSYSSANQSWYNSLMFNGTGTDGVSKERWSIVATLQCTNIVDGRFDTGNPYFWRLAILVRRQNVDQNSTADTRIQLNLAQQGPCERGELSMRAYLNVRTASVLPIDPPNISLGASITDKIGLFNGQFWINNPKFFTGLSVHDVDTNIQNIQFGPIFPENEVSRLN